METYFLWKTIHVFSATILMGTGIGIAFFCWFGSRAAIRSNDIGALRVVLRFTVRSDFVFTAPAVVIQAVTGALLLNLNGWSWFSPWGIVVTSLFVFIGLCWLPVVWIQWRLRQIAASALSISALPVEFKFLFRAWCLLGLPAFLAMLMMIYLMVAKPLPLM